MPQHRGKNSLVLDILDAVMQGAARRGNGDDLEMILQKMGMMEPERGAFVPHQLILDSATDPLIREMLKMMDATEQEPVGFGTRRHPSRRMSK